MCELIKSIQARDPARPGFFEVVFSYPGYHAVGLHRVSAFLWSLGLRGLARFWAHLARLVTGIEIHPGAKIGKRLFIDHGMGVVIGETSVIGDDVTMYHGVTLGGHGKNLEGDGFDSERTRRHPLIEDGVMIGAGAHVLGPVTIGTKARIGANAVVMKDVPSGCTAIGNPAHIVNCKQNAVAYGLPARQVPDPVWEALEFLEKEIKILRKKIEANDETETVSNPTKKKNKSL